MTESESTPPSRSAGRDPAGAEGAAAGPAVLAAGLILAIASAVGFLVTPLDMPTGTAALADHYDEHRTLLLVLCYSGVLTMAVVAAVFVTMRQLLVEASPVLATTGLVAGVLTLAMTILGLVCFAAIAYAQPDAEITRVGSDLGWTAINLGAGPPTFVSLAAYTLAISDRRAGRRWFAAFGLLVAAAHLVVAASFARSGFLAPAGGLAQLVPVLWFAWIAVACAVLMPRARRVGART